MKVIQVMKKLEELERDQEELNKLVERISTDRDYSDFLKNSFHSEIQKISKQVETIYSLKIAGSSLSNTEETEKKTGDVKKLYAINEKNLNPKIVIENIQTTPQTETKKQEKQTKKY